MPHPKFFCLLAFALLQFSTAFADYEYLVPPEFLEGKPGKPLNEALDVQCLQLSLDYCQGKFAKALGSDPTIFRNPTYFTALVKRIFTKEINADQGFFKMCAARNDFATCLGDKYQVCTDLYHLVGQQKYDRADAFVLAGIYDNMDFDCSSGFTQVVVNWKCVVLVHNSDAYKTKSSACFNTYNQTYNNVDAFCDASETYSKCLADIYNDPTVNTCDFKELMWWECERALRRSKLDGICSTTTCTSLFDKQAANQYSSLMDQINKNGLLPEARLKYFRMANKLVQKRQNRQA